jgi:hypothetical protein
MSKSLGRPIISGCVEFTPPSKAGRGGEGGEEGTVARVFKLCSSLVPLSITQDNSHRQPKKTEPAGLHGSDQVDAAVRPAGLAG